MIYVTIFRFGSDNFILINLIPVEARFVERVVLDLKSDFYPYHMFFGQACTEPERSVSVDTFAFAFGRLVRVRSFDKRDLKQAKKEGFKVGYGKFTDNKINDSQTERLETFESKLALFGKYPN